MQSPELIFGEIYTVMACLFGVVSGSTLDTGRSKIQDFWLLSGNVSCSTICSPKAQRSFRLNFKFVMCIHPLTGVDGLNYESAHFYAI